MSERPLSHTKRGKLLAAAGGLAGGPLGVIVSPFVLMLVNAGKKDGNRFLIWFLLGIPISAGLWFIQIIPVITILAVVYQNSEEWTYSPNEFLSNNGMEYWQNSIDAKKMMKNPDWCNHEQKFTGLDGYEILTCFARDWNTVEKNDHKVIECVKEPELGTLKFVCTEIANKQFTEEQISIVRSHKQ